MERNCYRKIKIAYIIKMLKTCLRYFISLPHSFVGLATTEQKEDTEEVLQGKYKEISSNLTRRLMASGCMTKLPISLKNV